MRKASAIGCGGNKGVRLRVLARPGRVGYLVTDGAAEVWTATAAVQ